MLVRITKFSLYSLICAYLRDNAFNQVLSAAPKVIVSSRPKSHYGTLPFLHAARDLNIPACYLAHTHIDASKHFQYQVFRRDLFTTYYLISNSCREIAEKNFEIDAPVVVSGDPAMDSNAFTESEQKINTSVSQTVHVLYAASTFYGQDSMHDLAEVTSQLGQFRLSIKTRPPGNDSSEIRKLLGSYAPNVDILDHAIVGSIEKNLAGVDIVVGCATNAVINTMLLGVPSIVYINESDRIKIEKRNMEALPYENYGIPVVSDKDGLADILRQLQGAERRREFLLKQRKHAGKMYPNFSGTAAAKTISRDLLPHFD